MSLESHDIKFGRFLGWYLSPLILQVFSLIFRKCRGVFTFTQSRAVRRYWFSRLHITWWVRNGSLGKHISKIWLSFKANDRIVWKCVSTVIAMLNYVAIIMNEPLNVWVAWVVFGCHDWGGIRLFCPNL